jgi:hypothetical protein
VGRQDAVRAATHENRRTWEPPMNADERRCIGRNPQS